MMPDMWPLVLSSVRRFAKSKRFHLRKSRQTEENDKIAFKKFEGFLSQEHSIPESPWLAITFAKKLPFQAAPDHLKRFIVAEKSRT